MLNVGKTVSVPKAAALCGVNRATISNWINQKKLYAIRKDRNYAVPLKELLLFLKSTGRQIPDELQNKDPIEPLFKTFQHCWEYHEDSPHQLRCGGCVVLEKQLDVCFEAKGSRHLDCPVECYHCGYYQEIFYPRFQFIDQLDVPAAVCKSLFIWSANSRFADLCEVPKSDFPGMGLEKIIHTDSLKTVISEIKKLQLGDPLSVAFDIAFRQETNKTMHASISFIPLNQPSGTFLFLARAE
jgi:hypothetical protein